MDLGRPVARHHIRRPHEVPAAEVSEHATDASATEPDTADVRAPDAQPLRSSPQR